MGGRISTKKRRTVSRADEVRVLAFIVALILVFAGGTVAVVAITSEPDLCDLSPVASRMPGYSLLKWASLLRDHPRAKDAGPAILDGDAIEALGYMMNGDRVPSEGERVAEFILLPEAGNPLHPAHRFGDQMIAVHLRDDARLRFSSRALVWAWGTVRTLSGEPGGSKALYTLEGARAQVADKGEIKEYFR